MRVAIMIAAALVVAACGQTGALYLPDEGVETPVEIRSPAESTPATAPEPAPTPETVSTPEDKEKEKSGPPPGR